MLRQRLFPCQIMHLAENRHPHPPADHMSPAISFDDALRMLAQDG